MERRRVVVTGMGALSPIGNTAEENWQNAKQGHNGIDFITQFDPADISVKVSGEVRGFDAVEVLGRKEARRTDRVTHFALEVTRQAMEDSGLEVTDDNRHRVGVLIGTGIGGINTLTSALDKYQARGQRGVSPLDIPAILLDSSAGKVSITYGMRGPNFCLTTACATGNNCIGEATEIIRRNQADVMVAGSTESANVPMVMAGFSNTTALSGNNDPETASRPFDVNRDGFVQAEGAAVLILEELEFAKARGATIYGEVMGYGHTSDAFHVTAPLETGEGAYKAMHAAMTDAQVNPTDIQYISAHGTSTPLNDVSETKAIKWALGEHAYNIPMSSAKSMTGHMMGAAGSVEAVLSLMSIHDNFVHPTIHLLEQDPNCDLDYVANVGRELPVDIVMSNSFGFGGHNAVLIFGRYRDNGAS